VRSRINTTLILQTPGTFIIDIAVSLPESGRWRAARRGRERPSVATSNFDNRAIGVVGACI
jgi:hypothetical protein